MAAILNRNSKKPSTQIVSEFDFVGQILGNMEPLPAKSTKTSSKKSTKNVSPVIREDSPTSQNLTPTSHSQSSIKTNSASTSVSESTPPIIPSPATVDPNGLNVGVINNMFSSFQSLLHSQMEMFKEMRTAEVARTRDFEHQDDSDDDLDLPGSGDASPMDVCDQIDALLDSDTESALPKSSQNRPTPSDDDLPACVEQLFQDFSNDDSTGPEITNARLVTLLSDMLTKRLPDEKLKSTSDNYPRPVNMDYLQSPKVNPEIWRKLKTETKNRDIRVQKAQNRLSKGLTPLTLALQRLTNLRKDVASVTKKELDDLVKLLCDSFTLLGSASQEISLRRRELIRPDLNSQFVSLCSSHNPVTTQLFGDDLPKAMKEIAETNRVAYRVSGPFKGQSRFGNKGKMPHSSGRQGFHSYPQKERFSPYQRGTGGNNGQKFQQRPKNFRRGPQDRK